MKTVRFSEALVAAQEILKQHLQGVPSRTVLVRDLFGKIRIAVPPDAPIDATAALVPELHKQLGAFSPGLENILVSGNQLLSPGAIFDSNELAPIDTNYPEYFLLDRTLNGSDWLRPQFKDNFPQTQRITFYGLKGGVGRSTALTILSRHLASQGKNVLVVDLDLESPGVSSLFVPKERLPRFGVVDWFVEDAVGQNDEELISQLDSQSEMAAEFPGSIRIVPAYGLDEISYISKLSRVMLDVRRHDGVFENFADRLNRLVETLEERIKPDVVLLDSRAGIHDVAAVAIARLDSTALLFAANGSQTWSGYRLLFQHWQKHQNLLPGFRENLKIIDALVPETGRQQHRESALIASHNLFSETIYEEIVPDAHEGYNFDLNDPDAPHYPIPIFWNRVFLGFDPVGASQQVSDEEVGVGYGEFLKFVDASIDTTGHE